MSSETYLAEVLEDQQLDDDSSEMKLLQAEREKVETLIKSSFPDTKFTIRYGGSKAKNTLIRESYDLDLICYVESGDNSAGKNLEEIYNNLANKLASNYWVDRKQSALRLSAKGTKLDFHIDVVPGRFSDDTKTDAYIFQNGADEKRRKTNLDVHIAHIKNSGFTKEISLLKLWNKRIGLNLKTFALELLVIKILQTEKASGGELAFNLEIFWKEVDAKGSTIAIEDPANPQGNDLSSILDSMRSALQREARIALRHLSSDNGWSKIFGEIEEKSSTQKISAITSYAEKNPNAAKSWSK